MNKDVVNPGTYWYRDVLYSKGRYDQGRNNIAPSVMAPFQLHEIVGRGGGAGFLAGRAFHVLLLYGIHCP